MSEVYKVLIFWLLLGQAKSDKKNRLRYLFQGKTKIKWKT